MNSILQWVAVITEFIGLSLIAIELYFPNSLARLKKSIEGVDPAIDNVPTDHHTGFSILAWIGLFIGLWITIVVIASLWDPSLSVVVNVALTICTVFILTISMIIRKLIRVGVILGRGNSVGGVGLVLALIGFSIELSQLISS